MTGFDAFEEHDALGLAALVRSGETTSAELVEAALARIEARNPALNAVIHRLDASARGTAAQSPGGPFGGVPMLVKDLLVQVEGTPFQEGTRFLARHVSDHDTEIVRRLRRAGFVFVGKTNTPEFGILAATEPVLHGPTRNPWNLDHTPGGSSGGSAAAVAAGMVPLAHGNDGGGSIRIPASCCGLFGLKPSRGRTPLGPDLGEVWGGLAGDHGLTRSVRDSAALLDALAGPDVGAPYTAPTPPRPFRQEVGADPGTLRIAVSRTALYGDGLHPDALAAVDDAARLCTDLGHEVVEATPPYDKEGLRRAYLTIVAVGVAQEIAAWGRRLGRTPKARDFEAETWMLKLIGDKVDAVTYADALEAGRLAARRVGAFLEHFDLVLTATLAAPPARIGEWSATPVERALMGTLRTLPVKKALDVALDQMAREKLGRTGNTMLFNQTGQPAMSVPLWWNADGLPIGVQFVGTYGDEATLLRLAGQLEAARPWFGRRPEGLAEV